MTKERGLGQSVECNQALQNMYLFLDHELPDSARVHVQGHLDDCIPCLEAFEFEAELKTVIASRCRDEVPKELYTRIRSSLRMEIQNSGPTGESESQGNFPDGGIPKG